MDTFLAIPTSSSISLSSPAFVVDSVVPIIESTTVITPIEPLYPYVNVKDTYVTAVPTVSTMLNPFSSNYYYYDSGIGSSPLAQGETNEYLRYKFLDSELIKEHKDILGMLKVVDGVVKPASEKESGDAGSPKDVEKKVDFIGNEILTRSKNLKILKKIVEKNYNIRFYDLPHNIDLVSNTQAKYIKQKIREMRK